MKAQICPSILSANFTALGKACRRVVSQGGDWLHVDVMDGHFVGNLTLGPAVVTWIHTATPAFLDCHMMVDNPESYVEAMRRAGASQFTFHYEASRDPAALIRTIHDAGMRAGLAIKPDTPVNRVFPYIDMADLILVMTVEPGFGGQTFMPAMAEKVRALRAKRPNLDIQVDGGINLETIDKVAEAGANCIVAGAIFRTNDPQGMIERMRRTIQSQITIHATEASMDGITNSL